MIKKTTGAVVSSETNIHFDSITSIQNGLKIKGSVDAMNGVICSFIGNSAMPNYLLKNLTEYIPSNGISAINVNNFVYLTHSFFNSTNHDKIDLFYTKLLIEQIFVKSSNIIFYMIDHQADKSDYDELRKIRTQILKESKKIPLIFVIHQISNPITKENLNKLIEENKTYCDVELSNPFGFVTNSGKIITNHIFLEYDNSKIIEYIQNKINTFSDKLTAFSLIDTTKLTICENIPKYIINNNNFDMETKYIDDCFYLMPVNTEVLVLNDIPYYINSGDNIPENNELKYNIKILDTKFIVSVNIDGYGKEDIMMWMDIDLSYLQTLIIIATNSINRKFCILKFPRKSQIKPINNFMDFLARSENKLENKKLELHLNRI